MLQVGKYYRWCMSEDEQSGFDTLPSLWFKVTYRKGDGQIRISWGDGTKDYMHEDDDEDLYIPEVEGLGKYESEERQKYFDTIDIPTNRTPHDILLEKYNNLKIDVEIEFDRLSGLDCPEYVEPNYSILED